MPSWRQPRLPPENATGTFDQESDSASEFVWERYFPFPYLLGTSQSPNSERCLRAAGDPLRALLSLGPLAVPAALSVTAQIAEVLVVAHRIPLVHRDLKPENVLRNAEEDRVTVLDFGLAFIVGDDDRGRMTRRGVVAGTPNYLSPEQARAEDVGPATDIYALGCMLYEMLSGHVPFGGGETEGVL